MYEPDPRFRLNPKDLLKGFDDREEEFEEIPFENDSEDIEDCPI